MINSHVFAFRRLPLNKITPPPTVTVTIQNRIGVRGGVENTPEVTRCAAFPQIKPCSLQL